MRLQCWLAGGHNPGSTEMNGNVANEFKMKLRFPLVFTQGPSELERKFARKAELF